MLLFKIKVEKLVEIESGKHPVACEHGQLVMSCAIYFYSFKVNLQLPFLYF